MTIKNSLFLLLAYLYPVLVSAQDTDKLFKKITEINSGIRSGKYDFVSKLKFTHTEDTVLLQNSSVTFLIQNNHTLCRSYNKEDKYIDIYDTSQFKRRINLNDSNLYITLKNSPESDHILYDYVRPYFMMQIPTGNKGWEKESETDSSIVLLNLHNPDPQLVYKNWTRLYIDKKTYIPYKFIEHFEIIEPGVDTLIQYTEQTISNYRFNFKQDDILKEFTIQRDFPFKKIVQSNGAVEPIIDTSFINTSIADLKLTAMNGQVIDFGKTESKVILLDVYYSACYPCMLALPILGNLYQRYKDKGLTIIGINPFDKDSARLQKLLKAKNAIYPTCLNTSELVKSYKISAYPTILIFDSQKQLVKKITGYSSDMEQYLSETIENMLK
jgi:thiol-disulfide isomerase/thioredoxin